MIKLNVFVNSEYYVDANKGNNPKIDTLFSYKGVKLNYTNEYNNIDLIFWDDININNIDESESVLSDIKNHPCYLASIQNPKVPKIFWCAHEILNREEYEPFIEVFSKELKCDKSKIVLVDTILLNRKDFLDIPLLFKLKQFDFRPTVRKNDNRIKKFSCLNNKANSLRVKILDKLIDVYDGDIKTLRNENFISFRNVKLVDNTLPMSDFTNLDGIPSTDLSIFFHEIYRTRSLKYSYDFYKNAGLPWILDDMNHNKHYDMYQKVSDIYSNSFFSLISETDEDFEILSYDYQKFSEKVVLSLLYGNLPFAIVDWKYYEVFERAGFDFSYLKNVFDIDYKTNTPEDNFNSISKFIDFLKNKTLEEVKSLYHSLEPIMNHNKKLMEDIVISEYPNREIWDFFNTLIEEKHK